MFVLILLFILTPSILAAPASLCPTSCSCTSSGINLNARCNSLNFLQKSLQHEQVKLLVTLDVHNASLTKLPANLNLLSNLKSINLSQNKIQHVAPSIMPKSLEVLDASHNSIKFLPRDIYLLPNLKEVDFRGNPIFCDCESVLIRDQMLSAGIVMPHPVKCEHPEEHRGKPWQSVECKQQSIYLFHGMLGDAPYEGSGSEDAVEKTDVSIENEFIRSTPKSTTTEINEPEEGSGDDDGLLAPTPASNEDDTTVADDDDDDNVTEVIEPVILPVEKELQGSEVVPGCFFNCSTPSPIKSNNTDTLPAPGLFEGVKSIANDLGIIDNKDDSTTSSERPATTTRAKETVPNQNITMDAEIMDKGMNTDEELSKIVESSEKQSNSSFIFLAVFLLAIVCLVAYVVVKKRSAARNAPAVPPNTEEKEDALEEVELLSKTVDGIEKNNGTPESMPLINGHKNNDEDDVKTTNVSEPEPKIEDDVQLRTHLDDRNTLTPEAKRVTIKAGEIPNSTPKTPVLVIRHMNSDGSIVTTPEFGQRV